MSRLIKIFLQNYEIWQALRPLDTNSKIITASYRVMGLFYCVKCEVGIAMHAHFGKRQNAASEQSQFDYRRNRFCQKHVNAISGMNARATYQQKYTSPVTQLYYVAVKSFLVRQPALSM